MTEHVQENYRKAPITEAVLYIKLQNSKPPSPDLLNKLANANKADYPNPVELQAFEGSMTFGKEMATSSKTSLLGYQGMHTNGKQVYRYELDGFLFSRQAPYQTWDDFQHEAEMLWSKYSKNVDVEEITRVGIRFINRIDIPHSTVELTDYFRTHVQLSEDLPQDFTAFFVNVGFRVPEIEGNAIINLTNTTPHSPGQSSFILDIEISRHEALKGRAEKIWEILSDFRLQKNRIFEACITEKTRELFR